MKMMNKFLLGAVVVAFVSTSFAAEPLLSPRAQGNQIKVVKSSTDDQSITMAYVNTTSALLTPRAQGNQIRYVAGTNNDPNLAAALPSLYGAPKGVQTMPVYQIAPVK